MSAQDADLLLLGFRIPLFGAGLRAVRARAYLTQKGNSLFGSGASSLGISTEPSNCAALVRRRLPRLEPNAVVRGLPVAHWQHRGEDAPLRLTAFSTRALKKTWKKRQKMFEKRLRWVY